MSTYGEGDRSQPETTIQGILSNMEDYMQSIPRIDSAFIKPIYNCSYKVRLRPEETLNDLVVQWRDTGEGSNGFHSWQMPKKSLTAEVYSGSYSPSDSYEGQLTRMLRELAKNLDGNQVEYVTSGLPDNKEGPSYWNNWKFSDKDAAKAYSDQIYPQVIQKADELLRKKGDKIVWFDLFGGDGEMLDTAFHTLDQNTLRNVEEAYIIDYDRPSLNEANKRIQRLKENQNIHTSIRVCDPLDLVNTDLRSMEVFKNIHPNLVTIVGGLNRGVLYKDEAMKVASGVKQIMQPDGFMIVTGYSPCVLDSEDFQKMGFEVMQRSIPKNIATNNRPSQLYVLRNK